MASRNDEATPGDITPAPQGDVAPEPQGDGAELPKSDTDEAPEADKRSKSHSSDSRLSEAHLPVPEDRPSDVETRSTSDFKNNALVGHIISVSEQPAGTMAKFPPRFYAREEHVKINRRKHNQTLLCPSFKRADPELFNIFHERLHHAEELRGSFRLYIADGPNYSDPVLAKADGLIRVGRLRSKGGNTFNVTLPALGALPESEIKLGSTMSTLRNGVRNLNFKIDIDGRTETFEWRQTRGKEVEVTHHVHEGWKLVRTSNLEPDMGGKRKQRVIGFSSDGAEILAILSKKKFVNESRAEETDGMTRKEKKETQEPVIKHGRYMFSFFGNGLTGTLGQRWETMAVISGHILWLAHLHEPSKAAVLASIMVTLGTLVLL